MTFPSNHQLVATAGDTSMTLGQVATKRCSKCGQRKTLDKFSLASRNADGRQSWCRECTNTHQRAKYNTDKAYAQSRRDAYKAYAKRKKGTAQGGAKSMENGETKSGRPSQAGLRTSVAVSVTTYDRLTALRKLLDVGSNEQALVFAIDTAMANSKAIEIEKVKVEIEAAEQRLRILQQDAAPIAAALATPTSTTNGASHTCSRYGCETAVRGKYKMCLKHRRQSRDAQRARAKKLKRQAERHGLTETQKVVLDQRYAEV